MTSSLEVTQHGLQFVALRDDQKPPRANLWLAPDARSGHGDRQSVIEAALIEAALIEAALSKGRTEH